MEVYLKVSQIVPAAPSASSCKWASSSIKREKPSSPGARPRTPSSASSSIVLQLLLRGRLEASCDWLFCSGQGSKEPIMDENRSSDVVSGVHRKRMTWVAGARFLSKMSRKVLSPWPVRKKETIKRFHWKTRHLCHISDVWLVVVWVIWSCCSTGSSFRFYSLTLIMQYFFFHSLGTTSIHHWYYEGEKVTTETHQA